MLQGKSDNEIYNILVDIHGGRSDTYQAIWSNWIYNKSTYLSSNQLRGRLASNNEIADNISPEQEKKISKFMFDNTIGFSCTDFERF